MCSHGFATKLTINHLGFIINNTVVFPADPQTEFHAMEEAEDASVTWLLSGKCEVLVIRQHNHNCSGYIPTYGVYNYTVPISNIVKIPSSHST